MTNLSCEKEDIEKKLNSIRFRGPDYMGVKKQDELFLGHLRLAIIDLESRSNQPMTYGHYTIVFNGEIYNYKGIRSELIGLGYTFDTESDTEVVLKGYAEWGRSVVSKLNGMFAFAIYDTSSRKVFCSRDRIGVKPFYYYWKDGKFEICSQLRPISLGKSLKINEKAVSMYLDCTYIPSPFTIYENVYKLSPGNNLEIDLAQGKFEVEEYWNLQKPKASSLTYEEAKAQLHELLKDAVAIRLQSDVPLGCFLSGGIDSSLVAGIAAKISEKPIRTFSIGFDDPKYDESKVAAQFASIIQSDHTETVCRAEDVMNMIPEMVKAYDEPFADSSALPSLLLNKETKKYVTMALSGDGGDESFLGYNHFDWVWKFSKLTKIPFFVRNLFSHIFIGRIFGKRTEPLKRILRIRSSNDFIAGIFVGYNSLLLKRDFSWLSHYEKAFTWAKNLFQRAADLNIKLWLENDSNVKVDRASMAFSVEVRSPFLDYRIVEFARNLPVEFRYQKGRKKRILRDILKEYIPEKVFNQPKKGFAVPIGSWMKGELKEEFIENLSDEFLSIVPNLNIPKFKEMFDLHLKGKYDYSSYIWRVYVLSKWYQEFGYFNKTGVPNK